jgi:L-lactate dehydrogenase complex protein LldE
VQEVYFYATCLVDLFYPDAGLAGIELLQAAGVRVIFPRGQTCCGQPAFNCGYWEEARAVARGQLALFPRDLPVILPSGSCAGMMTAHYPELFHGQPEEAAAKALAGRVFELTQYLVEVLDLRLEDLGEPVKVTLHASCHAMRDQGVLDQPRRLLDQLKNVEVIPLAREKECCGFGGTFAVRQEGLSAAMACDKAEDAKATGAALVLSTDGGCLLNLGGTLERQGSTLPTVHIAQFLWERTHAR